MITIDLSEQQELDTDSKITQQITFTGNIDQAENTIMFFILKKVKKGYFGFFTRKYGSIVNLSYFM